MKKCFVITAFVNIGGIEKEMMQMVVVSNESSESVKGIVKEKILSSGFVSDEIYVTELSYDEVESTYKTLRKSQDNVEHVEGNVIYGRFREHKATT